MVIYFDIRPETKDNIIFIVHKLRSNILSPALRFLKVTEYFTEAQPRSNIRNLPNPEGW